MKYLYDEDQLVADFVAQMIPFVRERGFGNCRAIGVVDERNELVAGLVYHRLSHAVQVIELSAAALPGIQWLTPATLAVAYSFPFVDCGCQMVLHTTEASNLRTQRQLAALGCMHVTVPRLFGRDKDGVMCLLTYEAWAANKVCQRFWRNHKQEREKVAA